MENLSGKITFMREMAYSSGDINVEKVLKEFYDAIDQNEDILKECYKMDNEEKCNKSFLTVKRMLDSIENVIEYKFPEIKVYTMMDERRIVQYKQSLGVLGVFYNGDVYVTVELIAKAIKTGNAIMFNIGVNENIGTNNMIVKMIKEILERNNKPAELVEINFSEDSEAIKEEFDSVIFIGNRKSQKSLSKLVENYIVSGYGFGEIYIEDLKNEDFIKKIIENSFGFNIKVYIKKGLETDIKGFEIEDVEDAIKNINQNGSKYSSAIFTDEVNSQKLFVKRCKSKYLFINASPMLAQDLDIDIEQLYYKKLGMV